MTRTSGRTCAALAGVFVDVWHCDARGPDTSNARDGIYQGGGSQLLVTPVAEGSGYGVIFDIALQY